MTTATSRDRDVRVSCEGATVGVARKQRFGELGGGEVSLTRKCGDDFYFSTSGDRGLTLS